MATAYLGCPQYYDLQEREINIITTGISQGKTVVQPGGKKIQVINQVDREGFYAYCLSHFAR